MSGIFVLSLDTEIAWGTIGVRDLARSAAAFDGYRGMITRLLRILDDRDIAATWAVVGHLFLSQCDGHPDLPLPTYAWADRPEADRDPRSHRAQAPWYYGDDVVAMIRGARVAHEIGSHSFTHVMAGDPAVSRQMWEAQLAACRDIHAANGAPMRSLVFPRNQVCHVDLLPAFGVRAFRGGERSWYRNVRGRAARLCHLADRALGFTPPTYPLDGLRVSPELVDIPASQFLMTYDGVRGLIPTRSRVAQARRGLEAASRGDAVFHLWFHPFNLGLGREGAMFGALESVLDIVVRRRESGDIRVATMGDVADEVLAAAA